MTWNWQHPGWPAFTWQTSRLAWAEEQFLLAGGLLHGVVRHLADEDRDRHLVDAMSDEAVTTSQIEGEVLERASVQSSIRRQLGLVGDQRPVRPAEQGIAEMMVDVYRHFDAPLDEGTLFAWHGMVANGRTDLRDVGRYRSGGDPMQVVSGPMYAPIVHFEAPSAAQVGAQMVTFIEWFNRTAPRGPEPLPALTRAGIAHLYFESIHPFEDGNGLVGRVIAEKALAQSLGRPSLTVLAATILARRREYYGTLEVANKDLEITSWLTWFAAVVLEAQHRATAQVEFLIDKTRLLDRLRGQLNPRQHTVLLRMLREGPSGFEGGLSAGKYITIAKTSPATATRDLADLVAKGALARTGNRRHARYRLPIPLRPTPRVTVTESGAVV
jgi:Fic family protein